MKIIRNILWLAVVYFFLLVVKALITRAAFPTAYFYVLMVGCLQSLLLMGCLLVPLFSWMAGRWLHIRRPVMAALVFFAGLVIMGECLFAWWMFHPAAIPTALRDPFAYYYDYFEQDLIHFDKRTAVYDKDLFYTLKHDTAFDFRNIEFDTRYHTNRLGLRDEDSSLKGPRVICIGDSYTMGWGVQQDASFPSRLAAVSGWKVLNMGVASYGTAREIAALGRVDTAGLRWLVIQYCGNDLEENDSYVKNRCKLAISPPGVYDTLVHMSKVSRSYFPGKYFFIIAPFFLKTALNRIHHFFSLPWDRKSWGKDPGRHADAFLEVLAHAPLDFGKVKVLVTMMDTYDNMKGGFLKAVMARLEEGPYRERFKGNVHLLDVSERLGRDDLYILDLHFRPSGHIKAARAMWEIMSQDTVHVIAPIADKAGRG